MAEKNPHVDQATDEQLRELLSGKSPELLQLYMDVHRLVLETLPDIVYSTDCKDGVTGYGARQYGYDGWGVLALAAHSRWVSLLFMRGVDLLGRDEGLLEGTGKKLRHVKLRSPEALEDRRQTLRRMIVLASGLNREST